MQSPCSPLLEDYIEVFYVIHKGDVPSFQCEKNLRWSTSMSEPQVVYIYERGTQPKFHLHLF
jgi:hypothetical protein